jgi:hypothetical protein
MGGMPPAFIFAVGCLKSSASWSGEKFCFHANQRWGGGRAHSGVTVARVAGLRLEDGLSFRGQRIRERHIRGGQGCG